MALKEDVQEAKERMSAWWDREIIDRPVISFYHPHPVAPFKGIFDIWSLAKNYDGIEQALDNYELCSSGIYFGGENVPIYFLNYGPGIMAAVMGVTPEYKTGTMWFSRPTEIKDLVEVLESAKLDANNEWYSRLLRVTEYAAKRSNGNYQVSMTDLGGVLDVLSSFLGPTKLIIAMKKHPEIVDTCRIIVLEKLLKVYKDLQSVIDKYSDGCGTWLFVWCKKHYYTIQCDFAAFLSPAWFKRFALPDINAQAESLDYAIYHLDGPNAIPHLDSLLSSEHITGIQWVPGAGRACDGAEEWMPLYKKIEKAGKNIVMDPPPELLPHMYKTLDPKGLFARSIFITPAHAKCYLPKFVEGNGGELVEEALAWAKEKNLVKFGRPDYKQFLEEKSLELDRGLRKVVYQQASYRLGRDKVGYNISDMAGFT